MANEVAQPGVNPRFSALDNLSMAYGQDGRASYTGTDPLSVSQNDALGMYNKQFDTDWGGYADIGLKGVGAVTGLMSYFDQKKTNDLQRQALTQNMQHATMARDDRTNFLQGTASAFA